MLCCYPSRTSKRSISPSNESEMLTFDMRTDAFLLPRGVVVVAAAVLLVVVVFV